MVDDCQAPDEPAQAPDIYARLAAAAPAQRAKIVLALVESAPGSLLALAAQPRRAVLDEADFSNKALLLLLQSRPSLPPWWDDEHRRVRLARCNLRGASLLRAVLRRADLREAVLAGAVLVKADLRGASLEQADLQQADLAGARLDRAALGKTDLRGAKLEDASLVRASLRFARLGGAILDGADLRGADLWGADLQGATATGANLRGASLGETNLQGTDLEAADLRGADLAAADLRGARLHGADLRHASLRHANLQGAVLTDAQMQGLSLTDCKLTGAHLGGAWMEKTRLHRAQLGEAIGEERTGDYEQAAAGYLALEQNFASLGDADAASWAYRRRRRMRKRRALARARSAASHRHWLAATGDLARYVGDQLVEWVCDYGESIPRVLASMLAIFLGFIVLYGLTGTVARVEQTPTGPLKTPTHQPMDFVLFSLTAMAAPGNPPEWLLPLNEGAYFLTGVQTLLSIFLTGLLGFVVGNRIRR